MTSTHHDPRPQRYRIRVRGDLGGTIRSAFPALQPHEVGGDTVLAGDLADSAALHGVLAEIEALGLELVEVRRPDERETTRLPMVRPTDLTAEQRPLYDAFEKMTRAEEYQGFEVRNPEGAFIGPWGVLLHFPDLAWPLAQFIGLAQQLPGLSERARQVVILTIGGRFNVAYELYAHASLAARAGLRADQIATLSAGGRPADLSEDEYLAADVAVALTRGGTVPGPLYDAAAARLGRPGFDAVVFITVHYLALGTLLNAYDVAVGRPVSTPRRQP